MGSGMTKHTAAHRVAALGPDASARLTDTPGQEEQTVPTVGQRAARANAHARTARVADPAGARARVEAFTPDDPHARPHTALIRTLALAAGPRDPADAAELLTALAGHAAWLTATGHPVDADTLVDPDLVQRWILHGLTGLSAGTAANYRSRLARVGAAITRTVRPAPLHASDPTEPYAPQAESALVTWASGLRTPRMRTDVHAALSLGIGTGLSTAEIMQTCGTDVVRTDHGVLTVGVHGPRARLVPVRARYADGLTVLAEQAGPGPLFKPGSPGRVGKNALTNTIAAARRDGDIALPVLTAQRMRATWLVRHLSAGVRPDVLLAAAGLDDLGSLARYMRWVQPTAQADADVLLSRSRA